MRTQLSTLASQLQKAVNLVKPADETTTNVQQQRTSFFGQVVRQRIDGAHVGFMLSCAKKSQHWKSTL